MNGLQLKGYLFVFIYFDIINNILYFIGSIFLKQNLNFLLINYYNTKKMVISLLHVSSIHITL